MKIIMIVWVAMSFYTQNRSAVECVKSFDNKKQFTEYLNHWHMATDCMFVEGRTDVYFGKNITDKIKVHRKTVTEEKEIIERYELKELGE